MIAESLTFIVPPQPVDGATAALADELFDRLQQSKRFDSFKLLQKQQEWRQIFAAVKHASELGGALVVKFGNLTGAQRTLTARRVIEAAVDVGVLVERPRPHRLAPRQFELADTAKPKRKRIS